MVSLTESRNGERIEPGQGGSALLRKLAALKRDRSGTTALEFAMIAPVFFGLLLMTIESGLVFASQQMLDSAVYLASRQILTGSLQTSQSSGASAATTYCTFVNSVCNNMTAVMSLSSCKANLQIDMKDYPASTFSGVPAADLSIPTTGSGSLNTSAMDRLHLGNPGDYMLIRGYYLYPTYVNFLGGGAGTTSSNQFLLVGTAALKLEPYSGSGSNSGSTVSSTTCP